MLNNNNCCHSTNTPSNQLQLGDWPDFLSINYVRRHNTDVRCGVYLATGKGVKERSKLNESHEANETMQNFQTGFISHG
jgi:hypothetical protein